VTLSHWNPSTPNRVGLEYEADLASGSVGTKQLSLVQGWIQRMRSETAETVDGVVVGRTIAAPPSSVDDDYSAWLLEVLTAGSEAAVFGAGTDYLPNGDGAVGAEWITQSSPVPVGSLSVATQATLPFSLGFSADGTKAYIVDFTTAAVYQYTLSTAWDISTGTYATKSLSVTTQESQPTGMGFSADGTKAYVIGFINKTVYQYTLSTAWDISTGTYATKSLSVATEDTDPSGIGFSADGTKAYITGNINNTVYQYTLSTAWDISTGTYATKSLSVATEAPGPRGIGFSADGTSVYITDTSTAAVYQYTLSTAWDISTGTYATKSLSTGLQDITPVGIGFSADGLSVYMLGQANNTVYQYTLSTAWDISALAPNLYLSTDDTLTSTFVYVSNSTGASVQPTYETQFAVGAATFTSKRIKLQLKISTRLATGAGQTDVPWIIGFTTNSGTDHCIFAQLNAAGSYTLDLPEINPFTKLAWTQADVQAFDSTSRITLRPASLVAPSTFTQNVVYSMSLNVAAVAENRQAIAVGMDAAAATNRQKTLTLTQDDVTTAWTKAVNTTYSVVIRALSLGAATLGYLYVDNGTTQERWYSTGPTIPYLTGPTDPGWTGYAVDVAAVTADGLIVATGTTTWAAVAAGAIAQIIWLSGATERTDSQPYSAVRDDPVSTGAALYQEFLAPASASFDGVEFIGYIPSTARPTSDLTVEVQRISDSTVFGTGTVTPTAVDDSPLIGGSAWRKITVAMTSVVALVAGTGYKIVFSSPTPDSLPYRIQGLDTQQNLTSTGYGASGFGGIGSSAVIGGVARDEADVVAWAYDGPTPPASLTGVGGAVASAWTGMIGVDPVACPPTAVPYIALSWTATTLSGGFIEYDLQRRDAVDTTWQTIATIIVEATSSFADYEARMSVDVDYRIRAVSSYGAGSWSTIVGVSIEAAAAMLTFTTNIDRTRVVAVLDTYSNDATIEYDFAEASQLLSYPVHGRDTPVVFKPVERSGSAFERTVVADVFDLSATPPAGPDAVASLRDLAADAAVSLVCVRDTIGNRWFGNISVPSAAAVVLDGVTVMMTATIRVAESSMIPTPAAS